MATNAIAVQRQLVALKQRLASPEAMRKLIVDTTKRQTAAIEAQQGVLPKTTYVDGKQGAPLESVKPDGVVEVHFHALEQVVDWVYSEWVKRAPVGPTEGGHYREDISLFVDGYRRDADQGGRVDVAGAREVVLVNLRPYARKIARGLSVQAPEGWVEMLAREARRQFWGVARVEFEYRSYGAPETRRSREARTSRQRDANRFPAIVITRGA